MTFAPPMDSSLWALTADRLMPRKWPLWGSPQVRYLSEPRVAQQQFAPLIMQQQFGPMVIEFRQTGTGWLDSARQRLNAIADLKQGWDEASAPPIAPSLINSVWNFLKSDLVSSLEAQPDVVPTFDGGVLIEWHTTTVDLIIESGPDGSGSFYYYDNETHDEVEAAIGDRLDIVASAFVKLGIRR
jgi:hypothetical protein